MSTIKALLKMRYLEQLADSYEDGPLFDIIYFNGSNSDALAYLRGHVFPALFPNGLDEALVLGYDYMVVQTATKHGTSQLKPGDYVAFCGNNALSILRGFDAVGVKDGKIILS